MDDNFIPNAFNDSASRKGKAYANRRDANQRPDGDYYATPRSLLWAAEFLFRQFFSQDLPILDPCCGTGLMGEELKKWGYSVVGNDISSGVDYLRSDFKEKQVVMNPPFSLWDAFVEKAKSHADVIICIGRLNYLSTQSRYESGIWNGLSEVHCFTRYVDYQTPVRADGKFHVGAMATAWMVWQKGFSGKPSIGFVDVQPWAVLGNFRK